MASTSGRRFPPELRDRAVRMVFEARRVEGVTHGTVARVAGELGIGAETLRTWVRRTEIDAGDVPGTTSADAQRIKELERENKELRRANDILKAAAAFFGAELDRPSRR